MSDQITEQEIRRRLVLFLRIPNETWTDVLKLFPRRTLVRKISSVCYRLKEICDKSVKNIHVITNAIRFANKLKWDDPEANARLLHLEGNKCKLANQFRLTRSMKIGEKNKAILQHCLDLFKGCQISSQFTAKSKNSNFFECLTIFEPAKPFAIYIDHRVDPVNKFWLHPTVRNCNRISNANEKTSSMDIFVWLHHQPMELDMEGSASGQVRCLINADFEDQEAINVLLNRCVQNFEQSQSPADRRQFVLSFASGHSTEELDGFGHKENQNSGEVLTLARVAGASFNGYRLRRCSIKEFAGGSEEFYAKMFVDREEGSDNFALEGGELTGVYIE